MDNKLVYRILSIIALLSKDTGYTIQQLADRFDTSIKTIYRNIEILKEAGFQIEKDENKRLYLKKYNASVFSEKLLSFSIEEAALIKDALLATHSSHPLKNQLLKKLFAFSEIDGITEIFYDQNLAFNIRQISQAIKNHRQILLKNYRSASSNSIKDRIVEPISFHHNMKYFFAFEIASKKVKQFKPERAESVEILNQEFKYRHLHNPLEPDVFGVNGKPVFQVVLRLNIRAANLLREEYPASVKFINENQKKGTFTFSAQCKGYEGVGRFVLGLPGDITVLDPPDFIEFLKDKISMYKSGRKNMKIVEKKFEQDKI